MTTQYIIALSDFYFYAARDLPELCFCFPLPAKLRQNISSALSLMKQPAIDTNIREQIDGVKAYYFRSLDKDLISKLEQNPVMVVENPEQFFAHAELFTGLKNAELFISSEESRLECSTDRGEIFSENLMAILQNLPA